MDGRVHDLVMFTIRAECNKFRELSGIVCGRGLFQKMKGVVYRICIRSEMCCGAEDWAIRVENINKLAATEMRMLQMICEKTRKDKIRSEHVREMTGIGSITGVMRSQQLRWYEHVEKIVKTKH